MPLYDLEAMQARLAQLDAEREPLLALITAAEAHQRLFAERAIPAESAPTPVPVIRKRLKLKPKPEPGARGAITAATEDAVAEILDVMGPTPTRQLVELLADRRDLGMNGAKGDNRDGNLLSARLAGSKKFHTQRKGGGWWFTDRPWPNDVGEAKASPTVEGAATPSMDRTGIDAMLG